MKDDRVAFVTEREAERLWKRAAELQVQDSRRVEVRSRSLHPGVGPLGPAARHHYLLTEVAAAAREVGIETEFLERAISELQEERAAGETPPPDLIERTASRFFGSPPLALEATGRIPAEPDRVYSILRRLLPAEPYRLRLRDVLGEDPLADGTLVFDAPDALHGSSPTGRTLMAHGRVRRLYITLRAIEEGDEVGCRVTVRARVEADPEPAFWFGSLLTAGGSGLGGATGVAIAAELGLVGALVAAPVIGVALAGGALTYASYRARYVRPLVRSQLALEEMLEVLRAAVRTGGDFLPAERLLRGAEEGRLTRRDGEPG